MTTNIKFWMKVTLRSYAGADVTPETVASMCPFSVVLIPPKLRIFMMSTLLDIRDSGSPLPDTPEGLLDVWTRLQWVLENAPNTVPILTTMYGDILAEEPERGFLSGFIFQDPNEATLFKLSFESV